MNNNSPQRKFVKQKGISQYLKCSICLEVFNQPKRTFCGHTFCKSCLQSCIRANSSCPKCRVKIKPNQIGNDLIAAAIINQLKVLCPSSECPWRGQCIELKNHFAICEYKDLKANKKGNKNTMQQLSMFQDEDIQDQINQNVAKGSYQARLKAKFGADFKPIVSKTAEDLRQDNAFSQTSKYAPKIQVSHTQINGRTRRAKTKAKKRIQSNSDSKQKAPNISNKLHQQIDNIQFIQDLL